MGVDYAVVLTGAVSLHIGGWRMPLFCFRCCMHRLGRGRVVYAARGGMGVSVVTDA